VLLGFGKVARIVPTVQDTTEHLGMQGFHAAPKYFGKASEVFHGGYFSAFIFQKLLGAPGGVQCNAVLAEHLHQRSQAVFVVHGK
jgi:hypothetical protein